LVISQVLPLVDSFAFESFVAGFSVVASYADAFFVAASSSVADSFAFFAACASDFS